MSPIVNNIKHQKTTTNQYYKGLPVNVAPAFPAFERILDISYRELSTIVARYSRVVVVRLDLHPVKRNTFNPHNVDMTKFVRSFTRKLSKKSFSKKGLKNGVRYKSKLAYGWVKEYGLSKYNGGVHWHLWVALKNDENLQPHTQAKLVQDEIIQSWESYAGGANERNHKSAWFYLERNKLSYEARFDQQRAIVENIDRPDNLLLNTYFIKTRKNNKGIALGGVVDECFYAITYLAKVYSKVSTPSMKGGRLFASSNVGTKDSRSGRQELIESNLATIHKNLSVALKPLPVLGGTLDSD